MSNKFKKFCPNVWVAECEEQHQKGDVITLETKYGKEVECEVYNLLAERDGTFLYSIVRLEEQSYAERKAEKYGNSAILHGSKSAASFEAANEGKDFLSLGEPIKVGHHSEKRHRALLARNWKRVEKGVAEADIAAEKERLAKYWEQKAKAITLAMPESLDFFKYKLEQAIEIHKFFKENPDKREHSYSLTYANNDVKEYRKKVKLAEQLWG